MTTSAAVEGSGLVKRFAVKATGQIVTALDGVALSVAKGSLTALVGPDGAGKTTLLRAACGLIELTSGTLQVLGIDVTAEPQRVQDRISYMPQRFGLYEDLSVQENLDLYADLHGVSTQERVACFDRLLSMTDLGAFKDRPAGKLSGGMKQKLGLACTLVRSPELLLLDEPAVGVDPLSRRELWVIIEQLVRDEELTVLMSTAYLDDAERCDHVLLLREGKLLAAGTPAELRSHAAGRAFLASPPQGEPARLLQARLLADPDTIVDAVPQAGRVRFIRQATQDDAAVRDTNAEPAEERLEDGFMVLLRNAAGESPRYDAQPAFTRQASAFTSDDTVIDVKNLSRRFGDFTAVASTTFSVGRGEVFGLLGPNGAGKTTTFRMLCGLLPASSGSLRVAGLDMRTASGAARRRIGYVSQKFALYGNLSVGDNLRFFAGAYGLQGAHAKQRIDEVARTFSLSRSLGARANELPGGFKQRLSMATALLHEPDILFLDEPTSGADPLARRDFWYRITQLAQRGTTVIVTTHFMEEAEYCDRIVIQDAGVVLAIGTPQAVRERARDAVDMEQAFIGIVEQARKAQKAEKSEKPEKADTATGSS